MGRQGRGPTISLSTQIVSLVDDSHLRRLALTAWDLGGEAKYESMRLREHAHTFGFTGQLITKSRGFSTTFEALRSARTDSMAGERDGDPVEGTFHFEGRGMIDPRERCSPNSLHGGARTPRRGEGKETCFRRQARIRRVMAKRHFGTVRQRASGRWQALDHHEGRSRSAGTFRTKADALVHLSTIDADLHRGAVDRPQSGKDNSRRVRRAMAGTAKRTRVSNTRTLRLPTQASRPSNFCSNRLNQSRSVEDSELAREPRSRHPSTAAKAYACFQRS